MQSARFTPGAGNLPTGRSPILTRNPPSPTAPPRSSAQRVPQISNRHMMQLEITANGSESTTSLFLIVTKQLVCARRIACRAGCPPTTSHAATSTRHPRITDALVEPAAVVRGTRGEYTRENMNVLVATQQFQIGKRLA
jgi:hypothetical protein